MSENKNRSTSKWIDLNDSKATLKVGQYQGKTILLITGLSPRDLNFSRAIRELGFNASSRGAFLLKEVQKGEKISPKFFRGIWPNAKIKAMPVADYFYDLDKFEADETRKQHADNKQTKDFQTQEALTQQEQKQAFIDELKSNSKEIGRNYLNQRVFQNEVARIVLSDDGEIITENTVTNADPAQFMRAPDVRSFAKCVDGLILHLQDGNALRPVDANRFISICTSRDTDLIDERDLEQLNQNITNSIIKTIRNLDANASQATNIAEFFEQKISAQPLLNEASYRYSKKTQGLETLSLPLAAQAMRLLEDTDSVNVLGKQSAAFYGLLNNVAINFNNAEAYDAAKAALSKKEITNQIDPNAQALITTATGILNKDQFLMRLRSKAVIFGDATQIQELLDLAKGLKIAPISATGVKAHVSQMPDNANGAFLVLDPDASFDKFKDQEFIEHASLDQLKTHIDANLAASKIKEREASSKAAKFVEDTRSQNRYQRPYVTQSKISQAKTMIPSSMHTPLMHAFDALKTKLNEPDLDSYVASSLGIDKELLAKRLSAEQIDASALIFNKINEGKGFILADETGIGKGRTIAASISYALRNKKKVIFLSDRANLFSDIARDLKDVGVWHEIMPFILNSGTKVLNTESSQLEPEVIAQSLPDSQINKILNHVEPLPVGTNLILGTYSQLNREGSAKSDWVKEICNEDAVLILDEAHIANGYNSNISDTIGEMTQTAASVIYASATWANTAKNLHVYKRAMPESVNLDSVIENMSNQGEIFSEMFSAMLVSDGAMIRREHDLSKLEIIMQLPNDDQIKYNIEQKDKIAATLSAIAVLSGEINNSLQAMSRETRRVIQDGNVALGQIRATNATTNSERPSGFKMKLFKNSFSEGDALYQVMRRTQAALLINQTCEEVLETIAAKKKPIIIFDETGESFTKKAISLAEEQLKRDVEKLNDPSNADQSLNNIKELLDKGVAARDLVGVVKAPTVRDMLLSTLEMVGNITVRDITVDSSGAESVLTVNEAGSIGDLNFERSLKAQGLSLEASVKDRYQQAIDEILKMIDDIDPLPINVPDAILYKIKQASEEIKIEEISGRGTALEYIKSDVDDPKFFPAQASLSKRKQTKTGVVQAVNNFNNGRSQGIMINPSGATGISLHDSPRFLDNKQRVMFELQPSQDVRKRVQIYGRGNRYDQLSTPIVKTMLTGTASESRFIMLNNKKIAALSANIRSSRDNAILNDDVPDLINADGDQVAREYLIDNPGVASRLGVTQSQLDVPYGLMSFIIQRGQMLSDQNFSLMFSELCDLYKDVQLEREINGTNDSGFLFCDWGAKTIHQKKAWGPTHKQAEGLSAFDQPVYTRKVSHIVDYQPIQFEDLQERARASVRSIMTDTRLKELEFQPIVASDIMEMGSRLEQEEGLSKKAKLGFKVRELLTALAAKMPEATQLIAEKETSLINSISLASNEMDDEYEQEQTEMDFDLSTDNIANDQLLKAQSKAAPFESLASRSLAVSIRLPGQNKSQQSMALISKSGKSAKLYWVDSNNQTHSSYINLNKALALYTPGERGNRHLEALAQAITPLTKEQENEWAVNKVKKIYGSIFEDAPILSLESVIEQALKIIDAKKKIAMIALNIEDENQALTRAGSNPVKTAKDRKSLLLKLKGLVPGARVLLTKYNKHSYFTPDAYVVSKIELPPKGQEGTLSKWKFDLIAPGDEKPFRMSAASLLKSGYQISYISNVLEANNTQTNHIRNQFNKHKRHNIEKHHNLLIGNLYQSLQWSRAAKYGVPIIYTDETGAQIRAIDISRGFGSALIDVDNFPERIFAKDAIDNFVSSLWRVEKREEIINDPGKVNEISNVVNIGSVVVSTSMDSAIRRQKGNGRNSKYPNKDLLFFDVHHNIITITVPKKERSKIRSAYKDRLVQAARLWQAANPEQQEENNPYKAIRIVGYRAKRGSGATHVPISLTWDSSYYPGSKLELLAFNIIAADGMELFCANPAQTFTQDEHSNARINYLAKAVNNHYYEKLALNETSEQTQDELDQGQIQAPLPDQVVESAAIMMEPTEDSPPRLRLMRFAG